jgi:phosphoserine phosphatase
MEPPAGAIGSEQMRQVLEVSRMLAATADLDQLLFRIAQSATAMLACERASIFLHDRATDQLWTKVALQSEEIRVPSHAGIVGRAFKSNSVSHVASPYEDPQFNPEPDRRAGFVTRNLLTAPMVDIDRKPVGVIQAVNKATGGFEPSDAGMIQLLADHAGVAVQRYHLQQAAVEAVALRREMELAKQVQQALIPPAAPKIDGIDAVGWTLPASITGGDCYDLWRTADGRLGIFLADATGHGIGPAMVVSQARTLVRALCEIYADPRELLARANTRMVEDLDSGQFVTAFVGFLSPTGELRYCSAGQGPILIQSSREAAIATVEPEAPPLGVVADFMADSSTTVRLAPGGALYMLSDGIFEAFSPSREEFSAARTMRLLEESREEVLEDILRTLRAAVCTWQGTVEPRDDQTVVIARFAGGKT